MGDDSAAPAPRFVARCTVGEVDARIVGLRAACPACVGARSSAGGCLGLHALHRKVLGWRDDLVSRALNAVRSSPTDIGKDLLHAQPGLGGRLKEEQPARLLCVRLGVLARDLPGGVGLGWCGGLGRLPLGLVLCAGGSVCVRALGLGRLGGERRSRGRCRVGDQVELDCIPIKDWVAWVRDRYVPCCLRAQ